MGVGIITRRGASGSPTYIGSRSVSVATEGSKTSNNITVSSYKNVWVIFNFHLGSDGDVTGELRAYNGSSWETLKSLSSTSGALIEIDTKLYTQVQVYIDSDTTNRGGTATVSAFYLK